MEMLILQFKTQFKDCLIHVGLYNIEQKKTSGFCCFYQQRFDVLWSMEFINWSELNNTS